MALIRSQVRQNILDLLSTYFDKYVYLYVPTYLEWYRLAKAFIAKTYVKRFQNDWRHELENISDQDKEAPKGYLKENVI